jgi:uncharacterized protein
MHTMKTVRFQVKRLLKASTFTVAFVLFPLVGLAVDVKDVPNPRQINNTWVTDMAGILDEPTEAQLNSVISQLERSNGTEVAVVTVPETAPSASPKEFTTALFKSWGIGKKGQDNGVLLLISKGDRRVEIETGYGVEAILPDAKVGNIISTQITPRFKQGDFKGGTLAGTKALVVALEAPQGSSVNQQATPRAITSGRSQTSLAAQPLALEQEPTQDASVPWWLLIGGAGVLAIWTAAYVKSCDYRIEREETIPCLPPPPPPPPPSSSSSSGSSYSGSGDSGGSSYSGGGDSGGSSYSGGGDSGGSSYSGGGDSGGSGGSFGGGDSGGGGAGDSW